MHWPQLVFTCSLDRLALRIADEIGMDEIKRLVPFLSQGCLEELLSRCQEDVHLDHVKAYAPFLSSKFLMELIRKVKD